MTYIEAGIEIPKIKDSEAKRSLLLRLQKLLNSGEISIDQFGLICEELGIDVALAES